MRYPIPGWYFLTLSAACRGRSVFAELRPEGFRSTPLGRLAEREWRALCAKRGAALVTHAFELMPDHIHVLVHAAGPLPRSLGGEIGGYKAAVTACARRELGFVKEGDLWEAGFDARRKTTPQEIAAARLYAERNPADGRDKRAAKARYGAPTPIEHRRLPAEWPAPPAPDAPAPAWAAFGNPALLESERLVPVRLSRRATAAELAAAEAAAVAAAKSGTVLVSPALSPGERRVLAAALRAGGRAIHLECDPLSPYYRPTGSARLAALAEGRLLVLSPLAVTLPLRKPLAEALNACARAIAAR